MNIEAEAAHAVASAKHEAASLFHRNRPQPTFTAAESSPSSQPEVPAVTTPKQASVVESLHAITGEIQANPLVARLIQYRIGTLLTAEEADHFVALMAGIEQPRRPVAAQHDDGTGQHPVQ